jgi:hypothetical protein
LIIKEYYLAKFFSIPKTGDVSKKWPITNPGNCQISPMFFRFTPQETEADSKIFARKEDDALQLTIPTKKRAQKLPVDTSSVTGYQTGRRVQSRIKNL